jgi:hypothetical protein
MIVTANLENGVEESRMPNGEARAANMDQDQKPVFPLNDLEFEKITINSGWLEEVWGKWPGDETIEKLLAALKRC